MSSLASTSSVMRGNSTISAAARTETIADKDFLSQLPEEMLFRVFGFLSAVELAKCGEVSRRWRRLTSDAVLWNAFDLRKIFPLLKVFDASDWVTHVDLSSFELTIEDASPLDKRTAIPVLKRSLSSLPIEENAGVTLLTIPKGLTFNKLVKLAGARKTGNVTPFKFIGDRISNEIGDIPVDQTYRIVITNTVFKKSRNLSVRDQKALVNKIGCELPKVLEAAVLLVVIFMSSGERLYNDNPWTYTRCSERVAGHQLVVGGFSPDGVDVGGNNFDYDNYGVGGVLRKF